MSKRYDRDMLPDPVSYYESEGLTLKGPGKWKTTHCVFHGGSDSMRVNTDTGAFKCMACEVHGGDVLAYHWQWHGGEFMEAAEALGAVVDDGRPTAPRRTTLSPGAALKVIQFETLLIATTALATVDAIKNPADRARVIEATRVIQNIMQEVAD